MDYTPLCDAAFAMCRQELEREADASFVGFYLNEAALGNTDPEIRALVRQSPEYAALHPPAPPVGTAVSLDAPIKANYCGHLTPWGEPCFDIFLADWSAAQRQMVYEQKRKMGLTHIVVAAQGGYNGQHIFDWTRQPGLVRDLLLEVLGAGFRPIFAASSGDNGTGTATLNYLPALLTGLGSVARECHHFLAWECIKGGWTAKQYQDALKILFAYVPDAYAWFHGSDDASAGCSWSPVEADDPGRVWVWGRTENGVWVMEGEARDDAGRSAHPLGSDGTPGKWESDEPGFWSRQTGYNGAPLYAWKLTGQLFQTVSGDKLLNAKNYPVEYNGQRGYLSRVQECADRIMVGGHGWAKRRYCAFETVAQDFFNVGVSSADVKRIAQEIAALGVTEFGNGLP